MSSGCGDVLSLEDLKTAKKHQLFEAEVITGLQGGVAGGASIDYATNQVTGQTQKTLPAVLRDAGFFPASFDFTTGGTLTVNDRDKVVYDPVSKTWYSWKGTLPHDVAAGTNPIGDINWAPQTDPNLRDELFGQKLITKTLLYFGAKTDGTDTTAEVLAADAHSVATGEVIKVTKGEYKILNAQLGGSYEFEEDAYFVGSTGTTDNIIIAKNGLRMVNAKIKRTEITPGLDGDYGNAIRFGTYRQPAGGSDSKNFYIKNLEIYNITTNAFSWCIEILGDVTDLHLDGVKVFGYGAIIAHWGGDVGVSGDSSAVTYSYHPNNLRLSNIQFIPDSNGYVSSNALILSACYNVSVDGLYSFGANRTLWVLPGDVYNEVAVTRDKDKICTGITLENIKIDEPAIGNPAISLSGMPATKRTSAITFWGNDNNSRMDYNIQASINCQDIVYSGQLVDITGCKGVQGNIIKTGGDRSSSYWAVVSYCAEDVNLKLTGVSVLGVRIRGCRNGAYELNGTRIYEGVRNGSEGGCSIETFNSGPITVNTAAASGDTTLSATIVSADGIIFNGGYVILAGTPVARIRKSVLCKAGIMQTLEIEGLTTSISAGSTITVSLPDEGTTITGRLSNFLANYRVIDPWGLTLNVNCHRAYRTGIAVSGSYVRNMRIDGVFSGTGHENLAASRADIDISSSLHVNGLTISGLFDPAAINPYVQNRVRYLGTNHTGMKFVNCSGTVCQGGLSFNIAPSTVVGFYNQPEIMGVSLDANVAPAEVKVGIYSGHVFTGNARNNNPPTTGYWQAGSRLYIDGVIAGGQEGYICTVAGSPGTWKGFGSISS